MTSLRRTAPSPTAPSAPSAFIRISPTDFTGNGRSGSSYEWVENAQNNDARTSAYSPYITWYLSHWNQLRLQYTHTVNNVATGLKPNDAVYLQWAWIIGSHAHGWQQR